MSLNHTITLRVGYAIPLTQLLELYNAVNWTAYTQPERRDSLSLALRNSTYVVTAWNNEELVGLARGLTDDVSIFYLQDILVKPQYQRQGIGKRLLLDCLERYRHVRTIALLTDDNEQQRMFYESCGFNNTKQLHATPLNAYVRIDGLQPEQ